jgi:TetR/AcrR family transcriptional regulator, mexJK operon transcriptional repressor
VIGAAATQYSSFIRLRSPVPLNSGAPPFLIVPCRSNYFRSDGLSKKNPVAEKKARSSARSRPSPGRPTRIQAEQRHTQLLDRALDVFLRRGYKLATMEEIIGSIGMHKSTVYSLYADKEALFRATVQRAIKQWIQPVDVLKAAETDDLEATLIAIARLRMENSVSPIALKLQRIIIAESFRFPEITQMFWEQGVRSSVEYLTQLLAQRAKKGEILVEQPELIAHGFFTLTVGLITRMILLGTKMDQQETDRRIKVYVKLFLNGVRPPRR